MAFEFPSTITARKEKKKVEKKKKEKEISKMLSPLMEKKGMKGEIASMQLEDVFRTKDTEKIIKDKAKLKKNSRRYSR